MKSCSTWLRLDLSPSLSMPGKSSVLTLFEHYWLFCLAGGDPTAAESMMAAATAPTLLSTTLSSWWAMEVMPLMEITGLSGTAGAAGGARMATSDSREILRLSAEPTLPPWTEQLARVDPAMMSSMCVDSVVFSLIPPILLALTSGTIPLLNHFTFGSKYTFWRCGINIYFIPLLDSCRYNTLATIQYPICSIWQTCVVVRVIYSVGY